MRLELPLLPSDADANLAAEDAVAFEQVAQGDGAYEAERAKKSMFRGPRDGEREGASAVGVTRHLSPGRSGEGLARGQ